MGPKDRGGPQSARTGGQGQGPGRAVVVSKALSWILRHGAQKEGMAMDSQGYVNVGELLRWRKLRGLHVEMEEVIEAVRSSDKQRFALRYSLAASSTSTNGHDGCGLGGDEMGKEEGGQPTSTTAVSIEEDDTVARLHPEEKEAGGPSRRSQTETQVALHASASDLEPSHYFIRATQGHSIKTIQSAEYLTPIILDDASSMPETVVHGTFYAAWGPILKTGGLKPMNRVHVHFATGPSLASVLPSLDAETAISSPQATTNAVISGMRSDAQILIYIDICKALQAGVMFWRSENQVVLTEGVATEAGGKILAMEYWSVVVEIKKGLGVLWRSGKGIVQHLPPEWSAKRMPRGKERHDTGRGRGRGGGRGGGKPKLTVERDDVD